MKRIRSRHGSPRPTEMASVRCIQLEPTYLPKRLLGTQHLAFRKAQLRDLREGISYIDERPGEPALQIHHTGCLGEPRRHMAYGILQL